MAISNRHRVLVASDGSPAAQAALATAVRFPWAASARAHAVVARSEWFRPVSEEACAALARTFDAAVDGARRALSTRWRSVEVTSRAEPPAVAIIQEARRFKASVIVLGWRGHGAFKRLLAGSVSRTVAANAECPVLIVRDPPRTIRRFVVGFDGCPNAERALEFLCSLEPGPRSRAALVHVVQPVSVPASASRLPASLRARIHGDAAAMNEERLRKAAEMLDAAVARLKRRGWSAAGEVRVGAPLERLLSAVDDARADVLVLGARAVTGVERVLLGSVANGALDRCRVPVLLVR